MSDDQFGFDIDWDAKTQAYLDWAAPERMESGIRAFLAQAAPSIGFDSEWWKRPTTEQILKAAKDLFHDRDGFLSPENRDAADGFIRFYGECFVRRVGMAWTNRPEWSGAPLYSDFSPAVHNGDGTNIHSMVSMTDYLFDDGPHMADYVITNARRSS
ncbi:hypothetical protein D5S18_02865 [Nocardia panacis]|uniref:Uncharacterized protein n=1 Tax=Nocardia panacis TaxID=2340916 RepID=A0A3A4KEY4_9NOCA|nr:hypothetical protein [Nocardia panacis]RJO79288.1 hypothetical protein D5S18_02865 [Nocardia panacis]